MHPVERSGLVWPRIYGYAVVADVPRPTTIMGGVFVLVGILGLIRSESRAPSIV